MFTSFLYHPPPPSLPRSSLSHLFSLYPPLTQSNPLSPVSSSLPTPCLCSQLDTSGTVPEAHDSTERSSSPRLAGVYPHKAAARYNQMGRGAREGKTGSAGSGSVTTVAASGATGFVNGATLGRTLTRFTASGARVGRTGAVSPSARISKYVAVGGEAPT